MARKVIGTNYNRKSLDNINENFKELYDGDFLENGSVGVEKIDDGFLSHFYLSKINFNFGTVNANTGEIYLNSLSSKVGSRIVSKKILFSKGATFKNNLNFFNMWLNKIDLDGKVIGSTKISSKEEYILTETCYILIVIGTDDNSNFNSSDLSRITNSMSVKVISSDLINFEKRFYSNDLILNGNVLDWFSTSIMSDGENSGRTSNRITSDFLKVNDGTKIKSIDPNIKISFHKYNLDKKYLNYTSGWVDENVVYEFTESCFIKFVISNRDDSNISSRISNSLIVFGVDNIRQETTQRIKNILNTNLIDFHFGSINADDGNIIKPLNTRIITNKLYLNRDDVIDFTKNSDIKVSISSYDENSNFYNKNNSTGWVDNGKILIPQKGFYILNIAFKTDNQIININDVIKNLYIFGVELKNNIQEIKITESFDFSYGTGNFDTGEILNGGKNRIKSTKQFLKSGTTIKTNIINSSIQMAIYVYNYITGEYIKEKSMAFGALNDRYILDMDYFVVIILANKDNSDIKDFDELSNKVLLRIDYDNKFFIAAHSTLEKETFSYRSGFNTYQKIERFFSSIIFDRDNNLWGFTPSKDDHSDFQYASMMSINDIDSKWEYNKTFKHNWGHINTSNYSELNDWLVMATGNIGDTSDHSKKFWVLEDFSIKSNQSIVDISELIEYDTKHFGFDNSIKTSVAIQPLFGEPNDLINNIIYLLWNDGEFKYISRVLLGVGNNNLGNGTFIGGKNDNELNGTMKLLKTFKGGVYTDYVLTQDAIWFNGYIYEMLGHDGLFYNKIRLDNSKDIFIEEQFQEKMYTPTGSNLGCVNNGAAILDNKLYTTLTIGNDVRKTILVSRILT